MFKAIVTPLQSDYVYGESAGVLWDMGYRYTVLLTDEDDPTDVLDMVDFKTLEEAETYAKEVNNEQPNC